MLDDSLPPRLVQEASKLLKDYASRRDSSAKQAASQRLFEIFLQRADMIRFSKDFRQLEAAFGPVDESDMFNWSQMNIEDDESLEKAIKYGEEAAKRTAAILLGEKIKATPLEKDVGTDSEPLASEEVQAKELVSSEVDEEAEGESDNPKKAKAKATSDKAEEESPKEELLNPTILRDNDGQLWSGAILDIDNVQKTMPGNRVASTRVLVVIGNLQGSAGFGTGKGKNMSTALSAAFR